MTLLLSYIACCVLCYYCFVCFFEWHQHRSQWNLGRNMQRWPLACTFSSTYVVLLLLHCTYDEMVYCQRESTCASGNFFSKSMVWSTSYQMGSMVSNQSCTCIPHTRVRVPYQNILPDLLYTTVTRFTSVGTR